MELEQDKVIDASVATYIENLKSVVVGKTLRYYVSAENAPESSKPTKKIVKPEWGQELPSTAPCKTELSTYRTPSGRTGYVVECQYLDDTKTAYRVVFDDTGKQTFELLGNPVAL